SITSRQWKTERFLDRCAKSFGQFQAAVDGVGPAIYRRNVMIKQARAFAATAHSPKISRMTEAPDHRASKQALEIERDIRPQRPRLFQPRQQTRRRAQPAKISTRENMEVIDVRIAAQQCGPLRINHPGDLRLRMRLTNRRH